MKVKVKYSVGQKYSSVQESTKVTLFIIYIPLHLHFAAQRAFDICRHPSSIQFYLYNSSCRALYIVR